MIAAHCIHVAQHDDLQQPPPTSAMRLVALACITLALSSRQTATTVPAAGVLNASYRCLRDGSDQHLPHCDAGRSLAERVESIVSTLNASELVDIQLKRPVEQLQIGWYMMWRVENLHGVRLWPERCPFADRCTTIFPTASTSSRAFNASLWSAVGEAMATEGRVLFNLGLSADLSLRGPQVNVQRDPRWGRNSNSPSEDPWLTGMYGKSLVTGTQRRDASGVQLTASEMKHWTAYSVETGRFSFNAGISLHDLSETYMTPLRMMLEANVSGVMCAYDAIVRNPQAITPFVKKRPFSPFFLYVCPERNPILCQRLAEQHRAPQELGL